MDPENDKIKLCPRLIAEIMQAVAIHVCVNGVPSFGTVRVAVTEVDGVRYIEPFDPIFTMLAEYVIADATMFEVPLYGGDALVLMGAPIAVATNDEILNGPFAEWFLYTATGRPYRHSHPTTVHH